MGSAGVVAAALALLPEPPLATDTGPLSDIPEADSTIDVDPTFNDREEPAVSFKLVAALMFPCDWVLKLKLPCADTSVLPSDFTEH